VGGAPVTIYRELRRMADSETAHGLSVEFAAATNWPCASRVLTQPKLATIRQFNPFDAMDDCPEKCR